MQLARANFIDDVTCKHEVQRVTKNRFKLLSKVATTKMSSVYLALDRKHSQKVILKFLANAQCKNPKMRKRFNREANLGRSIDHPNVIKIRAKGLIKKRPFILIDYIDGQTLGEIRKEREIPIKECIRYLIEAAQGLQAIHSSGLVHRDIKPENLMLGKDGKVLITDLGLMTQYGTEVSKLTETNELMLSPLFASPEHARGKTVDWRSDIYSLGATFYYLLTGTYPYMGKSPVDTLLMHISLPLPPMSARNPRLPEELIQVIEKMMNKNPRKRHANCTELVAELEALLKENCKSSGHSFSFKRPTKAKQASVKNLLLSSVIAIVFVATFAILHTIL